MIASHTARRASKPRYRAEDLVYEAWQATRPRREALAREALAVLDHKDFAPLFGPGGVAEAPVVGRLGDHVIAGQIDRLVVTDTTVFVLDYKTQRPVPASPADAPRAYLRQMAAYRRALAAIYPGRAIRCCLVWTDGPSLMELPGELLDRHTAA